MLSSIILVPGAIILALCIISLIIAFRSFAPWIPSHTKLALKGLSSLPIRPGMKLVDLGCGDGRMLFAAYKNFGIAADGYEISLLPYCIAKLRQIVYRRKPIHIYFKNLFDANLETVDIVFVYGLPEHMNVRLLPKLQKELKKGAYIVSYNFSFSGLSPITTLHERWRNCFVYQI